jgi:MoaA/NifB/PqqE/SkfB family radical SAM enzyme
MMTKEEQDRREKLRIEKPLAYAKVMQYEKQLAKGKSVAMMQIQPNYTCNFHCTHCSVSSFRKQKRRIMTTDDIKNLCDQADEYGLAQIDLTGGEPLTFNNLEQILTAIGTARFYLAVASNGWLITPEKARWLKAMGVDRILLSFDSLNEEQHDKFRNKPGSYKKTIAAIDNIKNAGLDLITTSVITHQRAKSDELRDFLKFISDKGARIEALPPKLVGEWEGRYDLLLTEDDFKFLRETYNMRFHTSPHFGINMGCVAVKKIITVTAFGDVMPCIWMYYSMGNILETPLKEIIEKGMKQFGKYHALCRLAEDREFLDMYNQSIKGRTLPIPIEEVMSKINNA